MPAFACPSCGAPLEYRSCESTCASCGRSFQEEDGILHLVVSERIAEFAPFLEQYRRIRSRDGHGVTAPEHYRALPDVPPDDCNRTEWRLRRESFAALMRAWASVREGRSAVGARVLDVGAGNCWLSQRLARLGCAVVAVDISVDAADGLAAANMSDETFVLVQADFDGLPFAPAQFDLVVLNASLHYSSDPDRTLNEASRMLDVDGALAVVDSPMFTRPLDGEAMRKRCAESIAQSMQCAPIQPGRGFLTYAELAAWAERVHRESQFIPSRGSLRWRLGRLRARRRLGREPASFGVWIAR